MSRYKTTPLYDPRNGTVMTKAYLEGLSCEERKYIGDYLIEKFYKNMPLLRDYVSDDAIHSLFEELKNKDCRKILNDDIISNTSDSTTILSKIFFPSFFEAREKKIPSIKDVFNDKNLLSKVIHNRFVDYEYQGKIYCFNGTIQMMFQGCRSTRVAANTSIFKNIIGKLIYDLYVPDGGKIYDYSAGFGNRCIASQSLDKKITYIGTDPNKKLYGEFCKMIEFFKFNECKIYNEPSENFVLDEKFDFVFSSPPFFSREIYSLDNDDRQCYNSYPDYNDWLNKYWNATISNCKKMLKKDGRLGLNIIIDREKDMEEVIKNNGFELERRFLFKTSRSHLTSKSIMFRERNNLMDKEAEKFKMNEVINIYRVI